MDCVTSVIAIIVTYNRKKLLHECIESLFSQKTDAKLDILVIDNASTDGTEDSLQPYINTRSIHYINTGANLGGAGGFEIGVREAAKRDYDYIWIMDDDTIPSTTALKELLVVSSVKKNFGFLSSLTLWTDGSICTMNVQRKDIMRKLKLREFDKSIIPVEYATFVSLFVPMPVVRTIGAPIGEFFIWGDDWEYTRRISKKYPSYVVSDSVVVHKTSTNLGCDISNDGVERLNRYKYGFRNDAYIARQDGLKGRTYRWLKVAKNMMKIVLKSESDKKSRIKILVAGIKEGKSFNPTVLPIDVKQE